MLLAALWCPLWAQQAGVKTNLLYDATSTFNAGFEVGLSPRLTLEVALNYNPWTWKDNKKWKHWLVQPELRWWMCNRFAGHYLALHGIAGEYNVGGIRNNLSFGGLDLSKLSDNRYEGWAFGGGLAWGYMLPLSRHLSAEFEVGGGAVWSLYDTFDCSVCNIKTDTDNTFWYVGLTKAVVGLVYLF